MTFRNKLLVMFTATVVVAVGLVAWTISSRAGDAFERLDEQRTRALVEQFRREFERRGAEIRERVEGIASREATVSMALDMSRGRPDYAQYVNEAQALAEAHQLELLEFVADDGALISSAQWPAKFGYRVEWVTQGSGWNGQGAFLRRDELPDGPVLALIAVRTVRVNDKELYVIGGERLDREFLGSLVLPEGMRTLLYKDFGPQFSQQALVDSKGPVSQAEKLGELIRRVRQQKEGSEQVVRWSADAASAERFQAIPLKDHYGEFLGALLVGTSRREQAETERQLRLMAMLVGLGGVLIAVVLSRWAAARVMRPVDDMAAAAREVAAGNWKAQVEAGSDDELGQLADAFNRMTSELMEQRDRLVQAERVAAWRELARRLAHELKNPLFPLQITVENLLRARERSPQEFDEVFRESTTTLLAELANLKTIVGRFSDFARMPRPELQAVDINELAGEAARLFQAQAGQTAGVHVSLELDHTAGVIEADPHLLHRVLQNLVLNALDAMPQEGTLTLRTRRTSSGVLMEVADTGVGLTPEECERVFTPYYTSKKHGTGLGLAIVQSVVADHGGRVTVSSVPGQGTTFGIELPRRGAVSKQEHEVFHEGHQDKSLVMNEGAD